MVLQEEVIESIVSKYVKKNSIIAFGTSSHSIVFLKKLAFRIEEEGLNVKVVPTSAKIAAISSSLGIQSASINEEEIDLGIEFVSQIDGNYNFIKRESHSLVRDKIIAQSAEELIAITEKENFVKKLNGTIPFEITQFGWKKTLTQLDLFGKAKLREQNGKPFKTDSGNYLIDAEIDEIHSLEELESKAKEIPGVIETGLFIGYADRIILHNHSIEVKSRLNHDEKSVPKILVQSFL